MARGGDEGTSRRGGKKKRTTPDTTPPIPFQDGEVLFFENENQQTRFLEGFVNRKIAPPRFITREYLELKGFHILLHDLEEASVFDFCSLKLDSFNPTLVRAFYANLSFKSDHGGHLETSVNGVRISLNTHMFAEISGLLEGGITFNSMPYADEDWIINNEHDILRLMGIENPVYHSNRPTIHGMHEESRVLLYLCTRVLKPRGSSHTTILQEDTMMIHAIREHMEIKWAKFVMLHMASFVEGNNQPLPYALLIMRILDSHGIDVSKGELVKRTKLWQITNSTFREGAGAHAGEPQPPQPLQPQQPPHRPGRQATIDAIYESMQGMRGDIQGLRGDMQGMHGEIQGIRRDVRHLQHSVERLGWEQQRIQHNVDSYFQHINYVVPPFNTHPPQFDQQGDGHDEEHDD